MTKILFRTSGGRIPKRQLGLGHIYRCLNLGCQLKSHEIQFLIEDYGSVSSLLREHGFKKIFHLKPGIDESLDIQKTIDLVLRNKIDLLVIDKYGLTCKYVHELKKITKVVVISDLKNIEYDADLVANGFIGYNNKIAYNKFGARCLLGPRYQILNSQYGTKGKFGKKYDLLITLGGFDANNLMEIILEKIVKYGKNLKTKIILGPATIKSDKIRKFEKNYKGQLEIVAKTANMKKEISSSKFGICAGGITTYEFSAMQVPFAIICQYEHQIVTAREWQKRKIAKNLGFIQGNKKKLDILLRRLVQNKIQLKSQKIVDGLGSKRVAEQIIRIATR